MSMSADAATQKSGLKILTRPTAENADTDT